MRRDTHSNDRLTQALARLARAMGLPEDAARDRAVGDWLDASETEKGGAPAGLHPDPGEMGSRHSEEPAGTPLPARLAGDGIRDLGDTHRHKRGEG